jgi:hypothetical protein
MKNTFKTILYCASIVFSNTIMAQTPEHEAVKATMQNFLRAYDTGDGSWMRKAFRPDGAMAGHNARTDKVMVVSGEEFIGRFDGKTAADEAQRKRSFVILDVNENTALAKVTLDYPTWDGVDYISLSKIEGQWLIVSKVWSGKAKPGPKPEAAVTTTSSGAR